MCLTLLSAMVAQGPDSARDVYSHFDFNNKFLPGLLKKRCKKVNSAALCHEMLRHGSISFLLPSI